MSQKMNRNYEFAVKQFLPEWAFMLLLCIWVVNFQMVVKAIHTFKQQSQKIFGGHMSTSHVAEWVAVNLKIIINCSFFNWQRGSDATEIRKTNYLFAIIFKSVGGSK